MLKANTLQYGAFEMSFIAALHRPYVITSDPQAESELHQSQVPHTAALPKS